MLEFELENRLSNVFQNQQKSLLKTQTLKSNGLTKK